MNTKLVVALGLGLMVGAAGSALASGDAAAGKTKAGTCGGCHGANGEGMGTAPKIAAKKADDIVKQLQAFKSGKRDNATKKMLLANTSDQDMADVAAYYASLK